VQGCSCSKAVVSMQVQDRDTGKLMDETVPSYLRSVYRMMYQNPIGRRLIKVRLTVMRRSSSASVSNGSPRLLCYAYVWLLFSSQPRRRCCVARPHVTD
jgi:hypothetical protein